MSILRIEDFAVRVQGLGLCTVLMEEIRDILLGQVVLLGVDDHHVPGDLPVVFPVDSVEHAGHLGSGVES